MKTMGGWDVWEEDHQGGDPEGVPLFYRARGIASRARSIFAKISRQPACTSGSECTDRRHIAALRGAWLGHLLTITTTVPRWGERQPSEAMQ